MHTQIGIYNSAFIYCCNQKYSVRVSTYLLKNSLDMCSFLLQLYTVKLL